MNPQILIISEKGFVFYVDKNGKEYICSSEDFLKDLQDDINKAFSNYRITKITGLFKMAGEILKEDLVVEEAEEVMR